MDHRIRTGTGIGAREGPDARNLYSSTHPSERSESRTASRSVS